MLGEGEEEGLPEEPASEQPEAPPPVSADEDRGAELDRLFVEVLRQKGESS
jgi:hypothetical protein